MPASRSEGVPPGYLSDDDLEREMARLHDTRHSVVLDGTEDAIEAHTRRMLALEQEFLRRFPERAAPDAHRVRAARRQP